MNRLSVVDEIFLYRHRGLGLPTVMQGLWRTDDTVGAPLLISLHDALSQGPLGRRVVQPRVPGARPRFEPSTVSYPLRYSPEALAADGILPWADAQTEIDVDPAHAPGWSLSAANTAAGGTAVSLVCSHVLTDARGLITAVTDALAGRVQRPSDDRASDLRDALRLVGRVGKGLRHVHRRRGTDDTPPPRPVRKPPRTALIDVDADAWDSAAEAGHGTANSLFLAIVGGIARRAGIAYPLRIAVPVDTRDTGSDSNHVTMTSVVLDSDDTPATIRTKATRAYRKPRESAPYGIPDEILQLVPDRLAARLAKGAGERDLLCSNIGRAPQSLDTFGPHPTAGLAMRAMHPGLAAAPAESSTRLSAYLSRQSTRYTLALVALDEDHFPDRSSLRAYTEAEFADRGLTPQHW